MCSLCVAVNYVPVAYIWDNCGMWSIEKSEKVMTLPTVIDRLITFTYLVCHYLAYTMLSSPGCME